MGENESDGGGAVNDGMNGGVKIRLGSALQVVRQPWERDNCRPLKP